MKQPNWKTPLILSATLVALGGFTYWLENSHKPKKEKSDTAAKKPYSLITDDTQIASFNMRGTKTNLSAKCDDLAQKKCKASSLASWTIAAPKELKADQENFKSFINGMANAVAPETIDLSEETPEKRAKMLDEYGLSEAKRNAFTTPMVEFTLENGKKVTAWFGVEHPIGDKYFVAAAVDGKLNDTTIYLLSQQIRSNTENDLTYFRDKSIFNFNRTEVNALNAKTSFGSFKFEKKDQAWFMNPTLLDTEKVDGLLSTMAQLKAKGFTEVAATPRGSKSVLSYRLALTGAKKEVITFELFEKTDAKTSKNSDAVAEKHYYLKSSVRPDILEVDAQIRSQLDKQANDFRNTEILNAIVKPSLKKVKIEGNKYKEPLELESTDKNLSSFLDLIVKAKIKAFKSPAPALSQDAVKFTLFDNKNNPVLMWQFYLIKDKKWGDKVYLRDLYLKQNEAYEIDADIKNSLPFDSATWKPSK